MMKAFRYKYFALFVWPLFLVLSACHQEYAAPIDPEIDSDKAVEILRFGDRYQLYRNGKPYYIKGAAGYTHLAELKAAGGNAIRTWNTDGLDSLLDQAGQHDISVMVGLYVQPQRHGFDFHSTKARNTQLDSIRRIVQRYKNHPAVLMWGIGNELEIGSTDDSVWEVVNEIAEMIHKEDPNHPTTTMIMPRSETTSKIAELAPEIDVISMNVFGALQFIPERIRQFWWNWDGPYIISEWGGRGWWESGFTDWQAPLEIANHVKATFYRDRYMACMKQDTLRCMGGYVFYWGEKQERTHTWFSMFLNGTDKTAMVDMMQYLWTDKWPENRAPKITAIHLNQKRSSENIYLEPNAVAECVLQAEDPDGDSLEYKWTLMPEGNYIRITGGDKEEKPEAIKGRWLKVDRSQVQFNAPLENGPYRIFVMVRDGKGSATSANIPFYVMKSGWTKVDIASP